jgi:hypothetical protein
VIKINEKIKRMLIEFNPFWKAPMKLEYRDRLVYPSIKSLVKEPQIISLCGLRRVGKTTILMKIIQDLLKDESPDSILYFSFDDFPKAELLDIIDAFKDIHGKEPKFLFFDEIQKLPNWAEKVKVLYDTKKYKILISGSESLFLRKGSRESLAGRIYEFEINGLVFAEYLGFVDKKDMIAKPQLYQRELQAEMKKYFLTGGFPELIGKDKELIKRYIRTAILEKIVFLDMTRIYPIDNPSQLISILNILIDNPGMIVDYSSFSQELGISRQTVSKYFDYLEKAHLVVKLYNFSKNRSTSEKKIKKYYPTFLSPALLAEDTASKQGKIAETFCVIDSGAEFFWRDSFKDEVDIVIEEDKQIFPVEIKYQNKPKKNKGLEKFCDKYSCKKAMIITKDMRKHETNFAEVDWLPIYEFLIRYAGHKSNSH